MRVGATLPRAGPFSVGARVVEESPESWWGNPKQCLQDVNARDGAHDGVNRIAATPDYRLKGWFSWSRGIVRLWIKGLELRASIGMLCAGCVHCSARLEEVGRRTRGSGMPCPASQGTSGVGIPRPRGSGALVRRDPMQ